MYSFLKDKGYRELLFTTFLVITIGAAMFHYVEGWRWIDAMYFTVITLTTVGYGDFSPQTDAGKIIAIIYIFIGIGIILNFIQVAYDHYSEERNKKRVQEEDLDKSQKKS